MNFLNNQLLCPFDPVIILETEVVRGVVSGLEVGVVQGLFASNSFRRTGVEHPRPEISRKRIGTGEKVVIEEG